MRIGVVLLISLLLTSCNTDTNTDKEVAAPEWIHTLNDPVGQYDGIYKTVGSAESKNESILNALCSMAMRIECKQSSSNKRVSSASEVAFGKKVKVKVESEESVVGIGDPPERLVEKRSKTQKTASFSDGNKQVILNSFFAIDTDSRGSYLHTFELREQNGTVQDIIAELNNRSFEFEYYDNDDGYFTLVKWVAHENFVTE